MEPPNHQSSLVGAVSFFRHANRTPKNKAKLDCHGTHFPCVALVLLRELFPLASHTGPSHTHPPSQLSPLADHLRLLKLSEVPSQPASETSHLTLTSPTAAAILEALRADLSLANAADPTTLQAAQHLCGILTLGISSGEMNSKLKVVVTIVGTDPQDARLRLTCGVGGTLTQKGASDASALGGRYLQSLGAHRHVISSMSLLSEPTVEVFANYKDRVRKSAELFIDPLLRSLRKGGPTPYERSTATTACAAPVHMDILDFRPPEATARMQANQALLQDLLFHQPSDEVPFHPRLGELSIDGRLEYKATVELAITGINDALRMSRDPISPMHIAIPSQYRFVSSFRSVLELLGLLVTSLVDRLGSSFDPPVGSTSEVEAATLAELRSRYLSLRGKLVPSEIAEPSTQIISVVAAEVPDLYDSLTYDLQHNRGILHGASRPRLLESFCFLHKLTQHVTIVVQAFEAGFCRQERIKTSAIIAGPVLKFVSEKVKGSLGHSTRGNHDGSFIYVFMMSRMHATAVRTVLDEGRNDDPSPRGNSLLQRSSARSLGYLAESTLTFWQNVGSGADTTVEVDVEFSRGEFDLQGREEPTAGSQRFPLQRLFAAFGAT